MTSRRKRAWAFVVFELLPMSWACCEAKSDGTRKRRFSFSGCEIPVLVDLALLFAVQFFFLS